MIRHPPRPPLFPSPPLSRSRQPLGHTTTEEDDVGCFPLRDRRGVLAFALRRLGLLLLLQPPPLFHRLLHRLVRDELQDRKSTRLNSSHSQISYAVFCLKKKN